MKSTKHTDDWRDIISFSNYGTMESTWNIFENSVIHSIIVLLLT